MPETQITIPTSLVAEAVRLLDLGKEYTEEVSLEYDAKFGRSLHRHKREFESINKDVCEMAELANTLKNRLPEHMM